MKGNARANHVAVETVTEHNTIQYRQSAKKIIYESNEHTDDAFHASRYGRAVPSIAHALCRSINSHPPESYSSWILQVYFEPICQMEVLVQR